MTEPVKSEPAKPVDTATSVAREEQSAVAEPASTALQDNATEVDPEKLNKDQLQKLAEAVGVPKSGNKDEIANRINEAKAAGNDSATVGSQGASSSGRGAGLHGR